MNTTRSTLLSRVRDQGDAQAWTEFNDLYFALIESYARARGLDDSDASDVAADCMHALVQKMAQFQYDRTRGRFRAFLRRMVNNRVTDILRRRQLGKSIHASLESFQDDACDPQALWEQKVNLAHMSYCLAQIKKRVSDKYFRAFKLYALEGWPAERVSKTLGMSRHEVYVVKSLLIRRLRECMEELHAEHHMLIGRELRR